jgi:hypothetical protein
MDKSEFENRTYPVVSRAAAIALVASLSASGVLKAPLVRITTDDVKILSGGVLLADSLESQFNLDDLLQVDLESPDFVPAELNEFAARGFERRNRWS